jgi:signal transduction histidine kinase
VRTARRPRRPRARPRLRLGLRLGLRDRVTLAFGLLALALSLLLSVMAWTVVSRYLVSQRVSAALVESNLDRSQLETGLQTGDSLVPALLDSLPAGDSAASVVVLASNWYGTTPAIGPSSLPHDLVSLVGRGQEATQRVSVDGHLFLVVGLPLRETDSAYFELFSLDELDRAMLTLSWVLVAAAVVTAFLGMALGRFASTVALRPLRELNAVAAAVAEGHLSARLAGETDPDLGSLATSFNRTVRELEQRVRADARFAVDVSHELRTPLTTMLNSMQVIKNREAMLPAPMREPVALLSDDLERFRRLVVDLLEISRHDAGDQLVREPVRIADLVRRAADGTAGRPVTRVAPGSARLVMAVDKRRMERVVANLVGNAEAHGGGCTRVWVGHDDGTVRILVEDAGAGVPEEHRARVFDRFARHGPGDHSGVGLGLAIVQRHVAVHGGTVSVEDRPGGGARFVVELPTSSP